MMPDPLSQKTPRGPLVWTIQTVAVLGLLSIVATQAFIRLVGEPRRDPRVAASYLDPEVTGSIGRPARDTRLDPCAVRAPQSGRR